MLFFNLIQYKNPIAWKNLLALFLISSITAHAGNSSYDYIPDKNYYNNNNFNEDTTDVLCNDNCSKKTQLSKAAIYSLVGIAAIGAGVVKITKNDPPCNHRE